MGYTLGLLALALVLVTLTILAMAVWKLAAAVRIVITIIRNQAGIPTQHQNDEIDRLMARLG